MLSLQAVINDIQRLPMMHYYTQQNRVISGSDSSLLLDLVVARHGWPAHEFRDLLPVMLLTTPKLRSVV